MELGMYVAVEELDRSRQFYSSLFGVDPYIENDNFIGFEMGGGRFGIMKSEAYAFPMNRGNNVIPNIRVSDIDLEFARVIDLKPSMIQEAVTDLGAMKLFMFADPDGNVIEFHSIAS